jgi:hypothetical protein
MVYSIVIFLILVITNDSVQKRYDDLLSIGSHKLIQTLFELLHSICTLSQALSVYLFISVSTESLSHAVVTSVIVSSLASIFDHSTNFRGQLYIELSVFRLSTWSADNFLLNKTTTSQEELFWNGYR